MNQRPWPITSRSSIFEAVEKINRQSRVDESELHGFSLGTSDHIGSRFNEWRKPVSEFGTNPSDWEVKIKASSDLKNMDFTNKEWARSRDTTNEILNMILTDIKAFADDFKGLKIERYVRQGSSREGLKVIAADEFDTILLYHFEGFNLAQVQVRRNNAIIPEFGFLEVSRPLTWLKENYPKLCDAGVFEDDKDGVVKLNARALHQRVFESMIDRSVTNIIAKIEESIKGMIVPFRICRKMNPPSINITIEVPDEVHQHFMPAGTLRPGSTVRQIDVDIVPGILIRTDMVPDPFNPNRTMECPVYAVFKWREESKAGPEVFGAKADLLWRICSSGYEKHTFDVARNDQRMRYIMTALRLIKTYCTATKKRALADGKAPPPFTTVMRSYFLKHIAFYVILFLGYLHKDVKLTGVEVALQYFVSFLKVSLEKGRLPHFFHSNKLITTMYPQYPRNFQELRFDLFCSKSKEALQQARLSLDNHLVPAIFFQPGDAEYKLEQVKQEYKATVSYGEFF